jgi:hypothetical protein
VTNRKRHKAAPLRLHLGKSSITALKKKLKKIDLPSGALHDKTP